MTPLGLLGEFTRIARVRGVIAAIELRDVRREIRPGRTTTSLPP